MRTHSGFEGSIDSLGRAGQSWPNRRIKNDKNMACGIQTKVRNKPEPSAAGCTPTV